MRKASKLSYMTSENVIQIPGFIEEKIKAQGGGGNINSGSAAGVFYNTCVLFGYLIQTHFIIK